MKKITICLLVLFVVIGCMVDLASSADQHHHHHDEQTPHHRPSFDWWRSFPWWRRVRPPPPSHHYHHTPPSPSPPTHHHRHHPSPRHHMNPVPPPPPTAPVHYNQPPPAARLRDCSTALIYIDGCIRDLITSFFDEEKISVGGVCCRTISEISDDCFQEAFMQFESPHFTRAVRNLCAHQH